MRAQNKASLLALLAAAPLSGCGLEGLLNLYGGTDYQQPVTVIRGSTALPDPAITVLDASGTKITPFDLAVGEGRYEVQLISGNYSGLMIRADQGQGILEAFVPALKPESITEDVNLDVASTATVKFVEGLLGVSTKVRANLSDDLICVMGKKLGARYDEAGPFGAVFAMMTRVHERADVTLTTQSRAFQTAKVTPAYEIVESPLNPDWVSRVRFDYDGDDKVELTTGDFDVEYLAALQQTELSAPADPALVRTVFAVNFNEGQKSGTCGSIDRFRWVRDEPGKQMYFVGGIHQTSPVQDPTVDAMLGNRGGWTPNVIPMYDDGTNGDKTAGDGIWSVYFDLPRGVRIGYKYTWGNQGDLWTGTEEWPGNQRILEVVDVNDDGYVYRADNFGDEATNKDRANANPLIGGTLDWDEDYNHDGYLDAREVPVDLNNDCGPDEFVTPEWVPALTVKCEDFVAE